MIIVVGGVKGGSGKTTLATNLAVLRSATGKKVLLVDADEQKSSSIWSNQREALEYPTSWSTIQLGGENMHQQLLRMSSDYDDIIVDVGGRDTTSQRSTLRVAHKYIVPFKPRSFDIWTLVPVKSIINDMRQGNPSLKSYAVINMADSKGADNEDARSILSECDDLICLKSVIGQRKSFANASSEGLGVIELKIKDPKASQEITDLYEEIFLK